MNMYLIPFTSLLLLILVACGEKKESSKLTQKKKISPPVDLNKPVENPLLKKALLNYKGKLTTPIPVKLTRLLNSTNYLVPIITDQMKISSTKENKVIKKGSRIKFLIYSNPKNESFLPVFTDWQEIKKWTNRNVSTMVMPSTHLWAFTIKGDFAGVIINPGSSGGYELRPKELKSLQKQNANGQKIKNKN